MHYDILITDGYVFDGSGNPWIKGDIGIKNGRISEIGALPGAKAEERINAAGLAVSPGFIDFHCHSDALPFIAPVETAKILQGVTTETIGHCGFSLAPVFSNTLDLLQKYASFLCLGRSLPWNWQSLGDLLNRMEERPYVTNIASLVGHGTIRIAAMGFADREPMAEELAFMEKLLSQAFADGAFGLSFGLPYPPGIFSHGPEILALCRVAAREGGFFTVHMRSERGEVLDSVAEVIAIGEGSGAPAIISHHKTFGRENWGKSRQTLRLIEEARERGVDITCDAYPYIASNTVLRSLLPPWAHEGGVEKLIERLRSLDNRLRLRHEMNEGLPGWESPGKSAGWENVIISSCKKNKTSEGKNIQELASLKKIEPAEAIFDLLIEEEGDALMVVFGMSEEDVAYILKHPAVMVASDGIPSDGKPHPRYFGTFPRVLGKYVREEKLMGLPEAIRKITSMPAQRLGLQDRGMLKEGMWADITIFDAQEVKDKSSFVDPHTPPVGIQYVLVNGQVAVRDGHFTGTHAGEVLRKKGKTAHLSLEAR
jgi:N-acyl-D-amino-acid deacylase